MSNTIPIVYGAPTEEEKAATINILVDDDEGQDDNCFRENDEKPKRKRKPKTKKE